MRGDRTTRIIKRLELQANYMDDPRDTSLLQHAAAELKWLRDQLDKQQSGETQT